MQVLAGEKGRAQSSKGEGDFFSETAGKDIGQFGNLEGTSKIKKNIRADGRVVGGDEAVGR